MKEISFELADEGFIVISIHPGLVQTKMSKESSEHFSKQHPVMLEYFQKNSIPPDQSAAQMLKVVDDLKPENSGSFRTHDGFDIPF